MKNRILEKLNEFTYFIWLILLILVAVFVTYFYDLNKKSQIYYLQKALSNTYLNKSINSLTSKLMPRYLTINYKIQKGDTYENIIDSLDIPDSEKKTFLEHVKKLKQVRSLKVNQKIFFKIDRKDKLKIIEFKIEIDKKRDVIFKRDKDFAKFNSKIIEKNLTKVIIFKEGIIENSLYNTALNLGIKPNIIIEFARLYGFQVDFQRDIWKGDSFQIMFEQFENDDGSIIESGDIIYSNLKQKAMILVYINLNLAKRK